jgi:hypothetical protein
VRRLGSSVRSHPGGRHRLSVYRFQSCALRTNKAAILKRCTACSSVVFSDRPGFSVVVNVQTTGIKPRLQKSFTVSGLCELCATRFLVLHSEKIYRGITKAASEILLQCPGSVEVVNGVRHTPEGITLHGVHGIM